MSPTPVAKAFKVNWKRELTTPIGIAAGFAATVDCGIVRVGAAEVVVFEFDVADWVMFLLGDVEIEGSEVAELMIGMLSAESGAEESRIIPALGSLAPKAFVFDNPAERTSLAALAAGVTEVAGVAGLNSTRFWPTEVVLNCEYCIQFVVPKELMHWNLLQRRKWEVNSLLTYTEKIPIGNQIWVCSRQNQYENKSKGD